MASAFSAAVMATGRAWKRRPRSSGISTSRSASASSPGAWRSSRSFSISRSLQSRARSCCRSAIPSRYAAKIKQAGALLICQVQSEDMAKQALDAGADVLIAQGTEAGGHGASRTTLDIVPTVIDLAAGRVPVVAAGGNADGRGLAAMMMLGASGVLMGTRFYASIEADGADDAKRRIVAASCRRDRARCRARLVAQYLLAGAVHGPHVDQRPCAALDRPRGGTDAESRAKCRRSISQPGPPAISTSPWCSPASRLASSMILHRLPRSSNASSPRLSSCCSAAAISSPPNASQKKRNTMWPDRRFPRPRQDRIPDRAGADGGRHGCGPRDRRRTGRRAGLAARCDDLGGQGARAGQHHPPARLRAGEPEFLLPQRRSTPIPGARPAGRRGLALLQGIRARSRRRRSTPPTARRSMRPIAPWSRS